MLNDQIAIAETVSPPKSIESKMLHLLPLMAFVVDIFSPILIQYGILPAVARFLGDLAMAAMLGLVLLYVLAFDFIPKALLVIIGITLVWFPVALINGQSVLATAWGWWLLFKYPFVALFNYYVVLS